MKTMPLFKCTSQKEGCELLRAVCTSREATRYCVCAQEWGYKNTNLYHIVGSQ